VSVFREYPRTTIFLAVMLTLVILLEAAKVTVSG
jgi:hypothetical protein